MLELAEQGRTLSDNAYDAAVPKVREALLKAHFELREREFPVLVIVSGADGAGKGEMVHHLNEWLDPRGVVTHAFWDTSSEEQRRPEYWRYWRAMPGAGRIGILFGSWYSAPIIERVMRSEKKREFEASLERIVKFEQLLTDSGAVLVKLWLHLPKAAQRARLEELDEEGRIGPDDWAHFEKYARFRAVSESALERTHAAAAPWHLIDATDRRWRAITAAKALTAAIEARLGESAKGGKRAADGTKGKAAVFDDALDAVDLTQRLKKAEYEPALKELQERLSRLAWKAGAALPLALLAAAAARRRDGDLRPLLVRAATGGTGGGVRAAGRMGTGVRGDQRVRTAAHGPWRGGAQVLKAAQDHAGGLAEPEAARGVRRGGGGDGGAV